MSFKFFKKPLFLNIVLFYKVPGKPYSTETKPNFVTICWDKPLEKVDYFEVRYKQKGGLTKWKMDCTRDDCNSTTITEIMADTIYIFQVRGVFEDMEGPYGPISDDVITPKSLSIKMKEKCQRIAVDNPEIYLLPSKENVQARNNQARTKQLILGLTKLLFIFDCHSKSSDVNNKLHMFYVFVCIYIYI